MNSTLHNPANVTPEQIPAGYRIITTDEHLSYERELRPRAGLRCWEGDGFSVDDGYHGNVSSITYITPITEPVTTTADAPQDEPADNMTESMTEGQAKEALIAFKRPTADIANSIAIAPTNPTVRSFAYREMMGRPGFAAPSDPPTTLVEWLAIIKKAYTTPAKPVAAASHLATTAPSFEPSELDDDDTAFTVNCSVRQYGNTTYSTTVDVARDRIASIDIPVHVARDGSEAVLAYVRERFSFESDPDNEEAGDGDLDNDNIDWDNAYWDGFSVRDIEIQEDLEDECEPYLASDDEDEEDEDEF